ncbi:cytochrome c oxidase subunit II [Blastopirellula marina]|uniref:cytochrome c oxidase subunit II n=1 Tax=Blastopirellula marina TaxID=124 RepID=UPI001E536CB0|nr:cytochrome c oxidase subunit II [Blastopirellula marina]
MLSILAEASSSLFFPPEQSTFAGEVDGLFDFIYYLSAFFFVAIVAVMVYFVLRYHRRQGHVEQASASHNEVLEITWSVIPSILVGFIFFFGFTKYLDMREPPEDAYEIVVTASQWTWDFKYPNGATSNELHIPVGQPVRFVLQATDVLHSFYIPAFRIKMDCVPQRYTSTWVIAKDITGEGATNETHTPYDLFCAEYCGKDHSRMITKVYVHNQADFDVWLEAAANYLEGIPPEQGGEMAFKKKGCAGCHSVTGDASAKFAGPPLNGQWGTPRNVIARGSSSPESVVMDENYVRESVREPNAKVVVGRNPVMPMFDPQRLKDEEITAIIAYLKSLK